jgi:hypothetical protein
MFLLLVRAYPIKYECCGCQDSQTLSPRWAAWPAEAEFCWKTTMSAPVLVDTEKFVDVPR